MSARILFVRMRSALVSALIVSLAGLAGYPDCSPAALRRPDPSLQERAPEFPWPSFQRFWNSRCLPGCEIPESQFVDGSHIVRYGRSISLVVRMEEDIVRSMSARFSDPEGAQGGGQRWLKLVDSVIGVGVYRWPAQRAEEVRERFMDISQHPAEYMWRSSRFRRSHDPATGWEFTLDLLPDAVAD